MTMCNEAGSGAARLIRLALALLCLTEAAVAAPPARFAGKVVGRRLRFFPPKIVALTFDDGPSTGITPKVLDALAHYHAKATFFVLGSMAVRHPELLRREVAEGHEIGVHGWTHSAHLTRRQAASEVARTVALIRRVTGRSPDLLRPPYGLRKSAIAREAQHRGMAVILWTISSADSDRIGPTVIASNVIHTPWPGDIALMHDGAGHRATAAAVPQVLRELSAHGWRFVTISELLAEWDRWLASGGARARPTPAPSHVLYRNHR